MRKQLIRSLLALSFSAVSAAAIAQPAIPREYVEHPGWSLGFNFGMTDLWGDVGTQGVVDHYNNSKYWDKPCFMGGMYARYTAHPVLAVRFGINYGTLFADDQWNIDKAKAANSIEDDAYQRYLRNQDVRANVWEGNLLLEFNPMRMNSESKAASRRFQPYLMAGVGGFHFKPQSSLTDMNTGRTKWVDVYDLHLEGEDFEYTKATEHHSMKTSLWQLSVPTGIGFRWDLGTDFALGVEYLYRFTFFDRLDNVSSEYASKDYFDANLSPEKAKLAKLLYDKSWEIDPNVERKPWTQRGNKEVKDAFSSVSITFIYKIQSNKIPWWF